MSITPKGMSIQEAYRQYREGNLIVNRKYQRKLVWTLDEKQKLIESILLGYPIPLILFAERAELHGNGKYEILDGVQRLTAIFDFIENRIEYDELYFDVLELTRAKNLAENGIFDAVERSEKFLSAEDCAKILDYQLAITVYPAMEEEQMIDVFGRINSQGRQLSNHERRQAGVINEFSNLVKELSYELRGDVSTSILKLYEMPSISIDDYKHDMGYNIKADEVFWVKMGVLGRKDLKNSEDEEMIADILASILLESPFPRSKSAFDELYDEESESYKNINSALAKIDRAILASNIRDTISVLRDVIDTVDSNTNDFRRRVSNQIRNPVKNSFYSLFMAFYSLLVEEEKSPVDNTKILDSITGLQSKLIQSANYAKVEDRVKNVNMTKGLIQNYFVKKEPSALKHGPGLKIDFENSLRRSRIETARYEFKQGLYRMSDPPQLDTNLLERLMETITAIANSGQGEDGYLYIGIADEEKDVRRIKEIYGKDCLEKFGKYIVGIDREIDFHSLSMDQYLKRLIEKISSSGIDDPLKTQLLSCIDVIDYNGYSVIRILIPKQSQLTTCNGKVYIRNGNDTKLVEDAKQIISLNTMFT